jgi:2-oxoisovalerate dehydrogenase E1 component beta subunit
MTILENRPAATSPAKATDQVTLAGALTAALRDSMADDPRVVVFGEDVGPLGGVFRVTDGLAKEFGDTRIWDSPLAEAGIVGTAIGMAMYGMRPVVEMQFDAFSYPAFEQITSHLAKMHNRSKGTITLPIVVRIPYAGGIGGVEHHSDSSEAYWTHTPGLTVVTPSNPADAYSMLREAIASDDPVIFLEPKSRYWPKGEVDLADRGRPLHSTAVARVGTEVTLLGHGAMVSVLLQAADLAAEEGTSVEVLDLRSLSPIDYGPILESVRKTGRLVIAQEAPGFVSVGSEIAATVAERAFYSLESPVLRVSGFDTPFPPAKLETIYLPDADRVLEAVDRALAY